MPLVGSKLYNPNWGLFKGGGLFVRNQPGGLESYKGGGAYSKEGS